MANKTNNKSQTSKANPKTTQPKVSKPKGDNDPNSLGNYSLKRIVYVISAALLATLTGFIGMRYQKRENKEDLKQKEKEYDLRNQKAVELKQMLKKEEMRVDTHATIQPAKSFSIMANRPLEDESGWVVPWYAKKGQISFLVAGADSGKTICITDAALAAATGTTPTFLPKDAPNASKMDVIMYRLEERAGEMRERYGDGAIFPDNFQWITRSDIATFTNDGLIADITTRCKLLHRDSLINIDPLTKVKDWDAAKFISAMEEAQAECASRGVVLSVLITAHTDETQPWKPLTTNLIRGGDTLIQQAGAVFALRQERTGDGYRSLQTLKVPKGSIERSTVNVIKFVGRDEAIPGSYTHLEYVCEKKMSEALPLRVKAQVKDGDGKPAEKPKKPGKLAGKEGEIIRSYNDGMPVKQIADAHRVSTQAIYDVLDKAGVKRKRTA